MMMFARLKRSILSVALLAFSLAPPSRSQDAPNHTLGLLNGRWWKNETVEIRLVFISCYVPKEAAPAGCEGQRRAFLRALFNSPHGHHALVQESRCVYVALPGRARFDANYGEVRSYRGGPFEGYPGPEKTSAKA